MRNPAAFVVLTLALSAVAGPAAGGRRDAWGPSFAASADAPSQGRGPRAHTGSTLRHWHDIALDAAGLDHTPVPPGDPRIFGEQLGPGRSARAMAIVHVAMFDTINAIVDAYEGYTGIRAARGPMSMRVAVSQAAHDALVALYPSQAAAFDAALEADLAAVHNPKAKANGIALGSQVASTLLDMRAGDGAEVPESELGIDYFTSDLPGHWRQDPISLVPLALGSTWGECRPFVLESGDQFRLPPPPDMTSPEYAAAYAEAKALGGDGIVTPTTRTPEQTEIGIFWAYDGTPSLCAPPRMYNQLVVQIADQMKTGDLELAHLLALVNVAMADTAIAVWDSKYFHDTWRPVTAIRESDPGTGPTGLGDGNPATIGDPTFSPLGAPASNLTGPNFTPPFPAYPSGHAAFGGAVFQTLRRYYGTDDIPFTFVSDELNGETVDNAGNVRPLVPRSFATLSEAEEENGQSRIYLGIHWSFDKTEGIAQGRDVADWVFDHVFAPLPRGHH